MKMRAEKNFPIQEKRFVIEKKVFGLRCKNLSSARSAYRFDFNGWNLVDVLVAVSGLV